MKKNLILLAGALVLVFTGCGKFRDSFDDFAEISEDDSLKLVESVASDDSSKGSLIEESVGAQTSSAVDEDGDYTPTGDEETIRKLVRDGRYTEAINAAGEPETERTKYYVGIAYYGKMLMKHKFSESERVSYRDKALSYLSQVAYETRDHSLQARAHLWNGMAIHLNNTSLKKKRQAIGEFHRIYSTHLKDTSVYDDSILYTAKVYKQMGWYVQSRVFYKKLSKINSKDGRVYEVDMRKYVSPEEAGSIGLEEVRAICYADGSVPAEESTTESEPAAEETTVEAEPVAEETTTVEEEPVVEEATTEPEPVVVEEEPVVEEAATEPEPVTESTESGGDDLLEAEPAPADDTGGDDLLEAEPAPADDTGGDDLLEAEPAPADDDGGDDLLLE
jgi:hypothetical protein